MWNISSFFRDGRSRSITNKNQYSAYITSSITHHPCVIVCLQWTQADGNSMSAVHSSISWIFIKEQKGKKSMHKIGLDLKRNRWKDGWRGKRDTDAKKREDMNGLVLFAAAIWIQRTDFLLKLILNSIRLVVSNLSYSAIEILATWSDDRFFDDDYSQLSSFMQREPSFNVLLLNTRRSCSIE